MFLTEERKRLVTVIARISLGTGNCWSSIYKNKGFKSDLEFSGCKQSIASFCPSSFAINDALYTLLNQGKFTSGFMLYWLCLLSVITPEPWSYRRQHAMLHIVNLYLFDKSLVG